MTQAVSGERSRGGRLRIPRSRGAASGFLVILLGLWGALVPFLGPGFDFAYDPAQGAAWSATRGWLEVLPGVVAVVGGLLLVRSQNRPTAMLGGWLSVASGAWFVIGRVMATTLTIGEIGRPVAETETKAAWLELTYFHGLGALLVFLGAMALGRLSVRSVRDVDYAQRTVLTERDARADTVTDPDTLTTPATGSAVADPVGVHPRSTDAPRRSWRDRLRGRRDTTTVVGR
ncbi:hypothetical protein TUM20985_33080 [Mycobacterium antarcticum]|uniref:hypothetical protein n=1 Tax=unclassified Mycolicibacterium TaxID=2636767 RepID=UPI0023A0E4E4|nr:MULTISPECIES: hypothetical protein [unclassified Mycolicibacterium]BDX32761.1 hypothetical protein TUM20985_33080 [Mycolicibacterium sp. TUM20985]GLP75966.1 hypothetical protein TUM20983_30760 [Mycolicibacterium sp. TUM20983]GLP83688.1 hypothetical protein TUM20984_51080 [Mycolicibacterium sp. TUM20984]